jgi:hypothetical protein
MFCAFLSAASNLVDFGCKIHEKKSVLKILTHCFNFFILNMNLFEINCLGWFCGFKSAKYMLNNNPVQSCLIAYVNISQKEKRPRPRRFYI